jgi:hypothetical protein
MLMVFIYLVSHFILGFKICLCGIQHNLITMSAGLDEVVKQCRGKNLFFSADVEKHVQ